MKTAVSLPDKLYAEAEKTAQHMGIPRSQLFARALKEFIEHHQRGKITKQLNVVYKKVESAEFSNISSASLESIRKLTKNDAW